MTRYLGAAIWAAFLLATTGTALAQDEKKPKADELFSRLDQNGDGVVTEDEVGEEGKKVFERVVRVGDKNKDGKLTKEEFAAGLEAGAKRPAGAPDGEKRPPFDPEALFNRLDRNVDGKIGKDEIPERGAEFIQRLDANKDGEITKEEFKAGLAKARPTGDGPRPGPGGDGLLFRALDANGDGKISAEEMSRAGEALKKLDRNGDGAISREELGGPIPGGGDSAPKLGGILERLKQADTNGDGKLSKEEAPERLKEMFDKLDANQDGFLDKEEIRKSFEGKIKLPKQE